jgi:glycosyltransferase involved in cell wall biosynthesis
MPTPKIALAMIVKASDEEAVVLERCLHSVRKHIDGIFITITGENKAVETVAKKYKAVVSHFDWIDDFAAARNFSFEQVTKDYTHIIWLDADDIIPEAHNIKKVANLMNEKGIDGILVWYMYAFDTLGNVTVQHWKPRMCKNNGKMGWGKVCSEIHEDLVALEVDETRLAKLEKEKNGPYFDVHHTRTDVRVKENNERNLRIAKKQAEKWPEDPRAWWNLANAHAGLGHMEESIENFRKYLDLTKSDQEGYLAMNRIANQYIGLNRMVEAEEWAAKAALRAPWIPDAWLTLGNIYFKKNQWKRAKELLIIGMSRPEKESLVVFNPRDYDMLPMEMLIRCYQGLGQVDEAIKVVEKLIELFPQHDGYKKILAVFSQQKQRNIRVAEFLRTHDKSTDAEFMVDYEALEDIVKLHPALIAAKNQRNVRTVRPEKEIVYFCGMTGHEWNRESAKTGIGGSEEAVINLSEQWAKAGYKVKVYANIGAREITDEFGVEWKPFWMFNPMDEFDLLVLWRHPAYAHYPFKANKVVLDLHDVISPGEFTPARLKKIDKIFVKSQYQRELYPEIPDDKFAVIGNGIRYDDIRPTKKILKRMIYTSSYDRGLEHLLDFWPQIKKEVPEATLDIYYGWNLFDQFYAHNKEMMVWKEKMVEKMKQPGIRELGRVGHAEIALAMAEADIYAYSCHFEEIFCISAVKAQAAGCKVLATKYAALKEVVKQGYLVEGNVKKPEIWPEFTEKVIDLLKTSMDQGDREFIKASVKEYDWSNIAAKWLVNMV